MTCPGSQRKRQAERQRYVSWVLHCSLLTLPPSFKDSSKGPLTFDPLFTFAKHPAAWHQPWARGTRLRESRLVRGEKVAAGHLPSTKTGTLRSVKRSQPQRCAGPSKTEREANGPLQRRATITTKVGVCDPDDSLGLKTISCWVERVRIRFQLRRPKPWPHPLGAEVRRSHPGCSS